jgi:hypothetical protein
MANTCSAYKLGQQLVRALQLHSHPLRSIPLVVTDDSSRPYTFPNQLGRWVPNQGATEAATFLAEHLTVHYDSLLTAAQGEALTKPAYQLALLRSLRPCLPDLHHLQAAHRQQHNKRIPVLDGWIDSITCEFTSLPYSPDAIVTWPAINFCYKELLAAAPRLPDLWQLLHSWFPVEGELRWVLRYLAHTLAPKVTSKLIVLHTDSLGDGAQGNRGKSSWLSLLRETFGSRSCSIKSGDALTVARNAGQSLEPPYAPCIVCFDELQRPGASHLRQLDWGLLKGMTSGRPPAPAVWICCNPCDLGSLAELQRLDPASYTRLVVLPGRTCFTESTTDMYVTIEELAPALGFCSYRSTKHT